MELRGWTKWCLLVAVVWFSFHTNLQTALDKVEGHHCCVCDAAAQDTPKATEGIVLWGAKLAADILCDRREGTQHATCMVTCNTKNQHQTKEHNGKGITAGVKLPEVSLGPFAHVPFVDSLNSVSGLFHYKCLTPIVWTTHNDFRFKKNKTWGPQWCFTS